MCVEKGELTRGGWGRCGDVRAEIREKESGGRVMGWQAGQNHFFLFSLSTTIDSQTLDSYGAVVEFRQTTKRRCKTPKGVKGKREREREREREGERIPLLRRKNTNTRTQNIETGVCMCGLRFTAEVLESVASCCDKAGPKGRRIEERERIREELAASLPVFSSPPSPPYASQIRFVT